MQKYYTVDFLSKRMKKNEGEVPQYYVENNHEAIIDPATFKLVQAEIMKRANGKNRYKQERLIDEFDKSLWSSLVEFITVYKKEDIRITFKDGIEVKV